MDFHFGGLPTHVSDPGAHFRTSGETTPSGTNPESRHRPCPAAVSDSPTRVSRAKGVPSLLPGGTMSSTSTSPRSLLREVPGQPGVSQLRKQEGTARDRTSDRRKRQGVGRGRAAPRRRPAHVSDYPVGLGSPPVPVTSGGSSRRGNQRGRGRRGDEGPEGTRGSGGTGDTCLEGRDTGHRRGVRAPGVEGGGREGERGRARGGTEEGGPGEDTHKTPETRRRGEGRGQRACSRVRENHF